jgi:hypothetical protein
VIVLWLVLDNIAAADTAAISTAAITVDITTPKALKA